MFLPILNSESIIARIPSVRILSRKLLNSSFEHIFSNSEFFWRFLNSRNVKIGNQNSDKNSVCQNSIEKSAEFNSLFSHFFQLWNILPWLESALSPVLMNKRPSKSMLHNTHKVIVNKFCGELFLY